MALNEGVMLSTLFGCGGMRHGSHHLYDDLDAAKNDPNNSKEGGPQEETIRDEDFD